MVAITVTKLWLKVNIGRSPEEILPAVREIGGFSLFPARNGELSEPDLRQLYSR
jgi:hypothetical protein